ncbi:MAG: hypothetical protein ACLUVC_10945 [Longibaculum sp.]
MKMKKKKSINKLSIVFYVVAAMMLLSFGLTLYNVSTYIMSLIDAGSVTFASNWLDIVLYYVNNTLIYLALAVLIGGCGYVIQLLKSQTKIENTESNNENLMTEVNEAEKESLETEDIVEVIE